MVDIFIKSFNRPYYLDRCLESIQKNIVGSYNIKVLDDGTPQKYLDKIAKKHPNITIILSKNAKEKQISITENIKTGKEINGFNIPTDLWISEAENATEYFIMTEDDVWFTQKTDITTLTKTMEEKDINLSKLGWLGNNSDYKNIIENKINEQLNATIPQNLLLSNQIAMDAFFNNKYKFFTILYKLKIVDNTTQRKYWALNSILMGLWKKEYWLAIWKNANGKVNEKQQLINASVYYKKHQGNPSFIARTNEEKMKTTFQSSATNSYHKYGFKFDVNYFNHLMNEAWLNGTFDSMQNFPNDFTIEYFESFLDAKINNSEFKKWVNRFKTQYQNLGCQID